MDAIRDDRLSESTSQRCCLRSEHQIPECNGGLLCCYDVN